LTITAPVQQGENTIKIGVADTGDQVFDSGLFLSQLQTSDTSSGDGGVKLDVTGTESDDDLNGSEQDEFLKAKGGNDSINPGAGNDVVEAGPGNDEVQGGQGDNQINGGPGIDTVIYPTAFGETPIQVNQNTVTIGSGTDTLTNVEFLEFSDQTASSTFLDTLSLTAANPEKAEGNNGTTAFTFTVTRPDNVTGELAFNYEVTGSGNNPADAEDFGGSFPTGTVTFTGEETEKQITVDATGDSEIEPNEQFTLTLNSSKAGGEVAKPAAIGTILNDDDQGNNEDLNLVEGSSGRDRLAGTEEDDRILGKESRDLIRGGEGDDVIEPGPGRDVMVGQAGEDQFVLKSGHSLLAKTSLHSERNSVSPISASATPAPALALQWKQATKF